MQKIFRFVVGFTLSVICICVLIFIGSLIYGLIIN